jgi:hypothetical protein
MSLKSAARSIRVWFSNIVSNISTGSDRVTAFKTVTSDQVSFLLGMSDFKNMDEYDIYENLYAFEAEVGGAIDRMSSMGADAIRCFSLRDVTKSAVDAATGLPIPPSTTPLAAEMLDQANLMMDDCEVRENASALLEVLLMHGMVLTTESPSDPLDFSITIQPNKIATFLDDLQYKGGSGGTNFKHVITQANYLIINEGDTDNEVVYEKDKFKITKYKLTPVWATDNKGRSTFGIFSVSPVHRCILPVWESRQLKIIDLIWRQKNVPREHHSFSSDQFSLDNYTGSIDKRRTDARADAKKMLDEYAATLKNLTPDIAHVTLDTTDISMIENKSAGYMRPNERLEQLQKELYVAMSTPRAVVDGETQGSYAAMTVVSNYIALKVVSLTTKVKPLLLANMRKRLLAINPGYPVSLLDMKISITLANSKLDLFRQAAIMGQLGIFTDTEIRAIVDFLELRGDQRAHLVNTSNQQTPADAQSPGQGVSGTQGGSEPGNPVTYPETEQSRGQHATDPGKNAAQKAFQ